MDFTFSEDQLALGQVARELFERRATTDRLTELEAAGTRHDPALWKALAGRRPAGHRPARVGRRQRPRISRVGHPAGRGGVERRSGARLRDAGARRRHHRPLRHARAASSAPARRGRRTSDPHRGPDRARALRRRRAGHHRPPGRRGLAARRRQGHGARRPDRRRVSGFRGHRGRRGRSVRPRCACPRRERGACRDHRRSAVRRRHPRRTRWCPPTTASKLRVVPRFYRRSATEPWWGCARFSSGSPSAHCGLRPPTPGNASSSAARSAASRRFSSAWRMRSSTSRPSGGRRGTPRGCSVKADPPRARR